jgi:hypothetical protein
MGPPVSQGDPLQEKGTPAVLEGDAVPMRPTPVTTAATTPLRLAVLVLLLVGAGAATAPSAFAVDDLTRPDASVTHGPSCRPGGVEIQVIAGSVPYSVVLATTRHPEGEDSALLAAGETVLLHTADVAWGETIDSRLEYTAEDGSGVSYVDELDAYSFTRPSEEDCAALSAPAGLAVPGELPPAGSLAVTPAAADRPVPVPAAPAPTWPALAAGAALLASFCGVAVEGLRRRQAAGGSAGRS